MDISRFLKDFKKWEVEYKENYDLSRRSFIGIGAVARLALFPKTTYELTECVSYLAKSSIPFKVVGALSNLLFKDSYFDGVIIETRKINRFFISENRVILECGARISKIHKALALFGLSGFEEIAGIPGTLGGMLYSNAGAFGSTVSDFLDYAAVYDLKKQRRCILTRSELDFAYRHSAFIGGGLILLYARFTLRYAPSDDITCLTNHFKDLRMKSQPYNEKSLGSIFKREGEIAISRLIDEAGLKGISVGGAYVSEKHAGFIVNRSGAVADDVLSLIELIKRQIYERYGIMPREEIEII